MSKYKIVWRLHMIYLKCRPYILLRPLNPLVHVANISYYFLSHIFITCSPLVCSWEYRGYPSCVLLRPDFLILKLNWFLMLKINKPINLFHLIFRVPLSVYNRVSIIFWSSSSQLCLSHFVYWTINTQRLMNLSPTERRYQLKCTGILLKGSEEVGFGFKSCMCRCIPGHPPHLSTKWNRDTP